MLAVEGRRSVLVDMTEEIGLYSEFRVRISDLAVSHLQYADVTLLMAALTLDNVWSIKVILRLFELASG